MKLFATLCLNALILGIGCQSSPSGGDVRKTPRPTEPTSPPMAGWDDQEAYGKVSSGFVKLQTGMTKDEVAALVGYPRTDRKADAWQWRFRNTGMAEELWYTIKFKDGRLVDRNVSGVHYGKRQ